MSTAMAAAVAKGVTKDNLYLNAWWLGNLEVAVAVAANSNTTLHFVVFSGQAGHCGPVVGLQDLQSQGCGF